MPLPILPLIRTKHFREQQLQPDIHTGPNTGYDGSQLFFPVSGYHDSSVADYFPHLHKLGLIQEDLVLDHYHMVSIYSDLETTPSSSPSNNSTD